MIRKWILASLASAVMAAGMVGCGEEPAAPVDKKAKAKTSTAVKTETPAVKTETPAVKTETPAVKTETKTE